MENHIIFEKLDLLRSTISDKKLKKEIEKEDFQLFNIAIEFIQSRLNNTIPILAQDTDLTNASNDIETSIINLNNYIGSKNVGQLTNSKNSIKSAVNRIKNLPFPTKGEEFNFSSEISSFKNIVTEKSKEAQEEIDNLKTEITKLDEAVEKRRVQLQELEKEILEKATELGGLNKKFEAQYDKDRASYIEQLGAQEIRIKENTDELVKYLETKRQEAAKIVNVIGNIGATGNFQQIANDHKSAANVWRVIAVFIMLFLSGLVIWSVISLGGENYDWTKSVLRIIAAAVLSYPATYASRESSKHRKLENYNRKLELELSSIEAFIELLPDVKKQAIKEKLAEKYFGSTLDLFEDTDLKSDKNYSLQGIERLFKAIEPLIKK